MGSWVKVGNILLYEKNIEASPFGSIDCILHA